MIEVAVGEHDRGWRRGRAGESFGSVSDGGRIAGHASVHQDPGCAGTQHVHVHHQRAQEENAVGDFAWVVRHEVPFKPEGGASVIPPAVPTGAVEWDMGLRTTLSLCSALAITCAPGTGAASSWSAG